MFFTTGADVSLAIVLDMVVLIIAAFRCVLLSFTTLAVETIFTGARSITEVTTVLHLPLPCGFPSYSFKLSQSLVV